MKHDIHWREANEPQEPISLIDLCSFLMAVVVMGAFFLVELAK